MITLGLIPARGGSERLPSKNTIDLGGEPLIAWTIKAAQKSAMFDRLVCSTDDHAIAAVAAKYGCEIIDRPKDLSTADASSLPVVVHANEKIRADVVALLQPTSPFRSAEDISNAFELMREREADAVVSVSEAPSDLVFEIGHAARLRPKDGTYVCNGALYLITADHLMCGGTWYTGLVYAYRMPKVRSLDIDTKVDLQRAREYLLEQAAA